jgi:surfactin synthase thioesterase subunit
MPASPRPQRWLLRRPKGDAPARLFCFPYAGVGASMYHRWPRRIGEAEVCLVQLPGREDRLRDPHYGTYEELAGPLADALLPYLDRPYGFFGHCTGVLPALVTTVRLMRQDRPTPDRLFVSSQGAPHDGPPSRFLDMTDAELSAELVGLMGSMGATPHPDLIALNLRVLRADVEANRAYRLDTPVRLPATVHAISWAADREIRPEQMAGWREYAEPDRFQATTLPGEHYDFLGGPTTLLDVLADGMEQALVAAR